MKRIAGIAICLILLLCLCACSQKLEQPEQTPDTGNELNQPLPVQESADEIIPTEEAEQTEQTEQTEQQTAEPEGEDSEAAQENDAAAQNDEPQSIKFDWTTAGFLDGKYGDVMTFIFYGKDSFIRIPDFFPDDDTEYTYGWLYLKNFATGEISLLFSGEFNRYKCCGRYIYLVVNERHEIIRLDMDNDAAIEPVYDTQDGTIINIYASKEMLYFIKRHDDGVDDVVWLDTDDWTEHLVKSLRDVDEIIPISSTSFAWLPWMSEEEIKEIYETAETCSPEVYRLYDALTDTVRPTSLYELFPGE